MSFAVVPELGPLKKKNTQHVLFIDLAALGLH